MSARAHPSAFPAASRWGPTTKRTSSLGRRSGVGSPTCSSPSCSSSLTSSELSGKLTGLKNWFQIFRYDEVSGWDEWDFISLLAAALVLALVCYQCLVQHCLIQASPDDWMQCLGHLSGRHGDKQSQTLVYEFPWLAQSSIICGSDTVQAMNHLIMKNPRSSSR